MRALTSLFLFAGLVVAVQGQQQPAAQPPADLVVVKCSWAKERVPGWEKTPYGHETYELMLERVANERRMQQARNAGQKAAADNSQRAAKVLEKATMDTKKTPKTESPRFGYRYKFSLRNTGTKTIKAIDWDYVFTDPNTGSEVGRQQFTSEEHVRPGKEKEMSVFTLSPPSRTVSAEVLGKKEQNPLTEGVVLVRVEYSDGSVWQRR